MNCTECDSLLLELHYGELAPDVAREVESHLAGCADCARSLAEIRRTLSAMRSLPVEEPSQEGIDSLLMYAEKAAARMAEQGGRFAVPAARPGILPAWLAHIVFRPGIAAATLAVVVGLVSFSFAKLLTPRPATESQLEAPALVAAAPPAPALEARPAARLDAPAEPAPKVAEESQTRERDAVGAIADEVREVRRAENKLEAGKLAPAKDGVAGLLGAKGGAGSGEGLGAFGGSGMRGNGMGQDAMAREGTAQGTIAPGGMGRAAGPPAAAPAPPSTVTLGGAAANRPADELQDDAGDKELSAADSASSAGAPARSEPPPELAKKRSAAEAETGAAFEEKVLPPAEDRRKAKADADLPGAHAQRVAEVAAEAEELYARAEAELRAQRRDSALRLFLRIADEHPKHARAPDALLAAMRIEELRGNAAARDVLYAKLTKGYPVSRAAAEARRAQSQQVAPTP